MGLGEGESFIASDPAAILNYTREVLYLEDGQVCEVRRDGYTVHDLQGAPQHLEVQTVDWDQSQAEKGGYPHFMLKEIHEQPDVIRNTIGGRISEDRSEVVWEDGLLDAPFLETCDRIMIIA